ncbi:MAG: response regulator [Bacteroidetes bacterium]|nr:response regulator [Bacteroidota bacterium]
MSSILIIEDAPNLVINLKKLIKEVGGFKLIQQASTINEAKVVLTFSDPEIVILDLDLPDGSGMDLIPIIKHQTKAIVIIFTNHSDKLFQKNAFNLGVDHFLDKVKDVDKLLDLLSVYSS